jgi:DNA helicase-2/ATP-dependent DNA helicase PcrA
VVNYPKRGIGDATVGKITATAQQHGVSLWNVLSAPLEYNLEVNKGTANRLAAFHELISDFIEKNDRLNAFELAQEVIKGSGIGSEAYNDLSPEGVSREQNIQELLNAMSEFVSTRLEEGNEEVSLVDFLSEVSLLSDQDTDKEAEVEKVTMMTVHAAKGLEFNHVFVVGMEEDLFPSSMAQWEPRGVEEERRLFYVAITRAKKTCTITHAKSRFRNGITHPAKKSRFLKDIDPRFLSMNDTRVGSDTRRSETNDGFWGSLRAQRQQREGSYRGGTNEWSEVAQQRRTSQQRGTTLKRGATQPWEKGQVAPKGMKPVANTTPSKPLSKEAQALKKSDVIEHERFGRGVVTSIEMSGNDRRAFVEFESAGRKQLLLKFAKFTIVETSS